VETFLKSTWSLLFYSFLFFSSYCVSSFFFVFFPLCVSLCFHFCGVGCYLVSWLSLPVAPGLVTQTQYTG
jgi:hypothetical protein